MDARPASLPFRAIFFSFFPHSQFLSLSSSLPLIENVKKGSFSAANAEINGLLLEKSSRNLKARKCRGRERETREKERGLRRRHRP